MSQNTVYVWWADRRELLPFHLNDDPDEQLRQFQEIVGGWIEQLSIGKLQYYVNEEARIDRHKYKQTVLSDGTVILGNIVFLTDSIAKAKKAFEI